jgi:transposase
MTGRFAEVLVSGPTDGDVFRAYVQYALTPRLKPGDVAILDNLQPHQAAGIREMIEKTGAKLLYLPPYLPDFNPIENMWSKVKQHLRSAAARRFDDLQTAVWSPLDRVSHNDCIGFFRDCGNFAF